MPAELADAPQAPKILLYVWGFFIDLSRQRTSNGFGANPLTYSDIFAWIHLSKIKVTPWEIDLILKLDAAYLSCINKQRKGSDNG